MEASSTSRTYAYRDVPVNIHMFSLEKISDSRPRPAARREQSPSEPSAKNMPRFHSNDIMSRISKIPARKLAINRTTHQSTPSICHSISIRLAKAHTKQLTSNHPFQPRTSIKTMASRETSPPSPSRRIFKSDPYIQNNLTLFPSQPISPRPPTTVQPATSKAAPSPASPSPVPQEAQSTPQRSQA